MKNNISNDNIYDACVIGAGASGLVCASELAKRGYSTLLLEQNKKSGRKLYATGNGRCNIANAVLSSSAYYSDGFASQVVNSGSVAMLKRYLEQNGIPLTEKDGYMYPRSLQASSVVWALTDAARLAGVNIRYESRLTAVARTPEGGFRLTTESVKDGSEKEYLCNRLVLSAGSPAGSDLGAAKEGSLEKLLEDLGLPYIPFEPALCPLTVREDVSELAGVRARAVIRIGLSMDVENIEMGLLAQVDIKCGIRAGGLVGATVGTLHGRAFRGVFGLEEMQAAVCYYALARLVYQPAHHVEVVAGLGKDNRSGLLGIAPVAAHV